MFAATLIAHQRYVDEGDEYASDNAPDQILSRPFDAHHFQIGQEYDDPQTENGGKEEDHSKKDQDTAVVTFHKF